MTYEQTIISLFGAAALLLVAVAAGAKACRDLVKRGRE